MSLCQINSAKGKTFHIVLRLENICLLQKDRLYSAVKRMNGVYEGNTAAEQEVLLTAQFIPWPA